MGNLIQSMGEYPPEYNRAVHGHYNPSIYYGKRDTPLSEVKLGELGKWLGRRNKSPLAMIRCISRAYWRHQVTWVYAKKPGMTGFYQKLVIIGIAFFLFDYSNYKKHRRYRYH